MDQNSPDDVRNDSPYVHLEDLHREENDISMMSEEAPGSDRDDGDQEDDEQSDDEGDEVLHETHEDKRSLRPSNHDTRGSFIEHGDDSDPEIDSDAEDFHQPCLANALAALKHYFFNRLEQTIAFLGGSPDHLKGWKIQVVKRTGGLTLGLIEIFYFSHRGKKFRSRVEVACFLNLMPSIKNIRSMSRDQFYLNAIESRERHLISQQLALCNFSCEEIIFQNDVIKLVSNGTETAVSLTTGSQEEPAPAPCAEEKPAFIDFRTAKDLYFSFGNMIILDWGKLLPDAAFHTNSQLYPLGFRCLRQEHDVTLDRVVDCLCEIDAVFEGGDGSSVLQMLRKGSFQSNQIDTRRPLLPLFRLSVAWHIGDEKNIGTATEQDSVQVRVYEARSPQQAWQSAMLEGLGIKDEKLVRPGSAAAAEDPSTAEGVEDEIDPTSLEDQDEEELALRMKIREQRRAYFRVLRAEQSAGMQAAVRPRLSLETVDSFAEDLVMRLFEGMEGSINCRAYQFMDSREREAGKKNMLKGYSKAFTKAKNLDRVIRKNVYLAEQIQQLEQKRRRVEDLESRKRAKTEDKEMRSLLIIAQKSRTAKMREMEKNITLLKVAMAKTVKKRRDDAKLLAEILCDKEEILRFSRANGLSTSPCALKALKVEGEGDVELNSDGDHTTSVESRPEGLDNAIVLDGCVVGQLVEVWEFLNTFSKDMHVSPEDIPSVESLMQAVKVCDPAYRSIKNYTRGLERSFDRAVQYQGADLTDSQANRILNKLGVVFCSSLLREFDRIMGIDLAEMQLGGLRIPLNELTWREVARIVLLGSCCREVGVGDVDSSALLKGRGFFTTPESADRKVLKLARRRIKFAYVIRSELQESVYGFSSGLCVRLPAPANPYIEGTVFWTELIASLRQVPDSYGWLIYEIIKAAALAVCIIDTTAAAKKLKRSLLRTLSLPSFRMDHGAETKAAALQILAAEEQLSTQLRLTNGRWRKTVPASSSVAASESASDAMEVASSAESNVSAVETVQSLCDTLRLMYDHSPYMVPPSTFDLWAKQLREAARHADLRKSSAPTFTAASLEESDRQDAERDLSNALNGVDEDNEGEPTEGLVKTETKTTVVPEVEVIDDDTKQAEKLSIAMQRCYLVIRDVMNHPQTNPFNWPVDFGALPGYYKSIAQPLSLSEVRKYLVEGRYRDSIFNFYSDVLLVIENAMAYNQENSAVKLSAQKVLTIFERLFFETVLCWDNPLPFHDSCHACRSPHPISVSKAAVCDRCEGTYHLHCLDPPMHTPPRSEWYCLPCVEQKGVPTAHPYKTADVLHPTDPEARGEVVGMEQIRQTVMFVVEFGSVRELWDGKKVRQYAVEPQNEEIVLPKGTFVLKEDPESVKTSLGFSGSTEDVPFSSSDGEKSVVSVYSMPSGYSYEDYDRVCGIARAYTGWGASHYLVPPVIMDEHSLIAQNRAKHDTMFPQFRESVAALGPAAGGVLGDALSSKEWGTVLSALLHRVMDIASLNTTLGQMDDAVDDDLIAQIQDGVHTNSLPLEKVFAFVRGEGLIKTVKVVDPDAPVEPVRRGRKKRVVEGVAAAPVKPVASASSAAGDEEDGGEDDEEGEDEWDEDMDEVAPKKVEEKKSAKKAGSATKAKKVIQDDEDEMDLAEASFNAGYNRAQSAVGTDETDSADEDDLEFFDEHGNCLTSGTVAAPAMSPPQRVPISTSSEYVMGGDVDPQNGVTDSPTVPTTEECAKSLEPETEEEWNLRHLSRQKGREDALLTQTLVLDTLTLLDVDGSKEKEEEVFKLINQDDIGGDFYSAAINAIIKSCLGRPSESLVALEWTRGWEAKMEAMQQYLHEYTFQGKEMLCPICGFEEGYLSSPFVWGQTTEEWEADVAADTAQDVLTEPEPPNDVNAFPLAAGVSASTGIKGFRARYRVMKGLVWRPYNQTEAEVEEGECSLAKRTLKAGTQVMHECCANFMHFNRQMKQDKSRKMEDQRIVEVISGIGRAKCTPIGIDREGSFYWILRGCTALFVSTGGVETLREKSAHKCAPNSGRWSMYRNEAEISEVLNWLDPKLTNERILRKTLSILFPNAATEGEEGDAKPLAAPATSEVNSEVKMEIVAEPDSEENTMQVEAAAPVVPVMAPIKLNRLMSVDLMEQSADEGEESEDEDAQEIVKNEAIDESEAQEDVEDAEDAELGALARRNVRKATSVSEGDGATASGDSNAVNDTPEAPLTAKELLLREQRRAAALTALNNRPALTSRSTLLDIYNPEPEFTGKKASVFKFRKGDHVLVDASTRNHILWDARVLETKTHKVVCAGAAGESQFTEQLLYYKVRFDRWGSAYDGWYEECQLLSANAIVSAVGRPKTTARALAQESKVDFIRQNVWTPPELLQTLFAFNFINESQTRASGGRPRLTYSDCESAVGLLRSAMLMIEAALPTGSVDDSDDRWAEDFAVPWREAVAVASDAISLMQCQLMLEYGIRTSWLRPTGLKMFSCLPSRVQCARNATIGLVAIRVWVLDSTIKYDQIKKEDKPAGNGKGRPPKASSSSANVAASKAGGVSSASKKARK